MVTINQRSKQFPAAWHYQYRGEQSRHFRLARPMLPQAVKPFLIEEIQYPFLVVFLAKRGMDQTFL